MNIADFSDEGLIAEAISGDAERAFRELMRRYLRPVHGFLRNYLQDEAAAADCAQETFFKVWKNRNRFQAGAKFKVWLFAIARNTALDYWKKKKAFSFSDWEKEGRDASESVTDESLSLEDLFAQTEKKLAVQSMLDGLVPPDREVILLRYAEEMTFEEISEALKAPINTVKSRHLRALRKLRALHQKQPDPRIT